MDPSATLSSITPAMVKKFDEITPEMMGTASSNIRPIEGGSSNLSKLISADRSVEKLFEDEKPVDGIDDSIYVPDFAEIAEMVRLEKKADDTYAPRETFGGGVMTPKQIRKQEAIKAAELKAQEGKTFFSDFDPPDFLLGENGKFSGTKLLEAGAWTGIYSLVGWEVYINSPFFDRAGGIIPVVF